MNFQERMEQVAKEAERTNRITYLYLRHDCFFSSSRYLENTKWLFKAYPGGRKFLSVEGRKVLQSLEPANKVLQSDGATGWQKMDDGSMGDFDWSDITQEPPRS